MNRVILKTLSASIVGAILATGCGDKSAKPQSAKSSPAAPVANPLAIVLAYQAGTNRTDAEIRQRQEQIRAGKQTDIALERLGWLYVAKARETFDAGFYKLAEQSALALEARQPRCAEAMLLRAHVLQNLHRFKESEVVARELMAVRGLAFDYGVLGDALMEQGKLDEAISAYQQMADLRPDSQAFTRAAHVRWLKGDLTGAIEMMELAAGAVSARDAENAAWIFTRLAALKWQAANETSLSDARPDLTEAERDCETALALSPSYAPALLLRGKMLMAENKLAAAIEALSLAEKQNPLPEYQWALADALDTAGRSAEARAVESRLLRAGASADPRSFALFLATRGEKSELALRLAHQELATRADVFTHDALAWAQFSAGDFSAAQQSMKRALAEGTQDARLFFHASIIASHGGQRNVAQEYFRKAGALAHLLLPSERKQLCAVAARLNQSRAVATSGENRAESSAGGKSF